ncbi:MAG: hypothetical protein ABR507_06230 [Actinomycetota bacterium]|nr:hypothetical protein [Actinomycetota bacterium]
MKVGPRGLRAVLSLALCSSLVMVATAGTSQAADHTLTDAHTSTAYPDAAYSTACVTDDRAPQHGRAATGASAGDCNNNVANADITSVDVNNSTLLDLAGNDGVFGTADDAAGLDQVAGTGDEPSKTSITRTVPALSVTYHYAGAIPAFNTKMAPLTTGLGGSTEIDGVGSSFIFRNQQLERNILYPLCKGDTSNPAAPAEVRDYQGHYNDNWFFSLDFEWDYNGAVYAPLMVLYVNDPDEGIFNYFAITQLLVDTDYNPWDNDGTDANYPDSVVPVDSQTGLGKFYNYSISADRHAATITIPGRIISRTDSSANTSCKPVRSYNDTVATHTKTQGVHNWGVEIYPILQTSAQKATADFKGFDPAARTINDTISDMSFESSVSTLVGTPRVATCEAVVTVCNTPAEVEQDAIGLIGLSNTVDVYDRSGAPQRQGGLNNFANAGMQNGANGEFLSYSPGVYPGCPLPTFGGRVPPNPLWIPGTACATEDPVANKYLLTGESMLFGNGGSSAG